MTMFDFTRPDFATLRLPRYAEPPGARAPAVSLLR